MDKLEIDARVARLERRVSSFFALLVLGVAAGALALMLLIYQAGRSTEATVATPALLPATVEVARDSASMSHLDADLRKLHGLLEEGLIDRDDFQAKKRGLFAPILHVTDFAGDMQLAKKLLDENIIDRGEYGELKKKILEIGH
jgi:hypothetical protein